MWETGSVQSWRDGYIRDPADMRRPVGSLQTVEELEIGRHNSAAELHSKGKIQAVINRPLRLIGDVKRRDKERGLGMAGQRERGELRQDDVRIRASNFCSLHLFPKCIGDFQIEKEGERVQFAGAAPLASLRFDPHPLAYPGRHPLRL